MIVLWSIKNDFTLNLRINLKNDSMYSQERVSVSGSGNPGRLSGSSSRVRSCRQNSSNELVSLGEKRNVSEWVCADDWGGATPAGQMLKLRLEEGEIVVPENLEMKLQNCMKKALHRGGLQSQWLWDVLTLQFLSDTTRRNRKHRWTTTSRSLQR